MKLITLLLLCILTELTSCKGQNTSQATNNILKTKLSAVAIGDTVSKLSEAIMIVYQDKKNNYWFGSRGQGVFKYDHGKYILNYTTKHGLVSTDIWGIQEDKAGNIYFDTQEGISKFDGKTFSTLSLSRVSSSEWKSGPDDLWFIGNWNKNGTYRYDGKTLHHLEFPKNELAEDPNGYFTLRLTSDQMNIKLASLEKTFKSFFAGNPFEYFFVYENFNQAYRAEKQYSQLFTVASVWAIFIACLGLFGLATYTIQSRTREVRIRKVLGASIQSIVGVLSKEFLILIGIAILLASPIAYFAANQWLRDFAYRIDIQWWIFVLAGALVLSLTLMTIGFRAIKAARANPVMSLRTE